jgi:thiamine-phosphate pyrophosphorylase
MKPDRIVGVGGLYSRHDAMVAGEAGADYVMFGEPDAAGVIPSHSAVIERVSWWSEVFVLPCVGYASSLALVQETADANPDFILLDDAIWKDPRGARAALLDIASVIETHNDRTVSVPKAQR